MKLTVDLVRAVGANREWFTLTRVLVRVAKKLGGYTLELDGPIIEALERMETDGQLGDIVSISGVTHPPTHDWTFAFRIDESGPQIAQNATEVALEEAAPRLREVIRVA
jgi:hypothetical protein